MFILFSSSLCSLRFCLCTFIKWSQSEKQHIFLLKMKSFQLRQSRLCFPLYHPGRLYAFSPSARVSSLTFRAAPKLHLICTIPINRFQISCGYYEHEHGGQGSLAVAPVCTQTYKLLVSVHLSFDNKNTSLKLSSEHKTKRKGNGIMLHVLWKA